MWKVSTRQMLGGGLETMSFTYQERGKLAVRLGVRQRVRCPFVTLWSVGEKHLADVAVGGKKCCGGAFDR